MTGYAIIIAFGAAYAVYAFYVGLSRGKRQGYQTGLEEVRELLDQTWLLLDTHEAHTHNTSPAPCAVCVLQGDIRPFLKQKVGDHE